MKNMVLLIILLFTAVTVSGLDHRIQTDHTTEGFWSTRISWTALINEEFGVGTFFTFPGLMYIQGDFNTGEIGLLCTYATSYVQKIYIHAKVYSGYRYQGQTLGFAHTAFVNFYTSVGYMFADMNLGLECTWEQAVLLHMQLSRYVTHTFTDIYETYPGHTGSVTQLFPSGRLKLGLLFDYVPESGFGWTVAGGWLYTASPYGNGFESMMFGKFPFYVALGVCYTL